MFYFNFCFKAFVDPSTSLPPRYPASTPPLEAKWYIGLGTNSVKLSLTSWKKIHWDSGDKTRTWKTWNGSKTQPWRSWRNMPKTMNFVPRDPSQKKTLRIHNTTSRSSNCTPGKPLRNKTRTAKRVWKKFWSHQNRSNEQHDRESSILIWHVQILRPWNLRRALIMKTLAHSKWPDLQYWNPPVAAWP